VLESNPDVLQGREQFLSQGGFNSNVHVVTHHFAKRSIVMAQRLSYKSCLPFLAAVILLLAGERSAAQSPGQPSLPPAVADKPKPSEAAPAPKELSAQEVDGLIEKAFGRDCAELKRPIRLWLADVRMVIAAEKASVARDGQSVHFASASAALLNARAEVSVLRADEVVVSVDQPVKVSSELRNRRVTTVEVTGENSTITFTPPNEFGSTISLAPPLSEPSPKPIGLQAVQPNPNPPAPVTFIPPPPIRPTPPVEVRFRFKIDSKTSVADLLPTPPKTWAKVPLWTNEDLAKVAELTFGEPISKELPKHKAIETTAHVMAKINHLNLKKTDGFMLAMIEQRPDLRGLAFLMGDECRTREEQAKMFAIVADILNRFLREKREQPELTDSLLDQGLTHAVKMIRAAVSISRGNEDQFHRAAVAAMTQILMPESEPVRVGLAKCLATIPHVDATKALARLAVYSPEERVRAAAIEGLKTRREKDYTDILMQGFRYPLPAVSKRAAEALVKLERKDLLGNLVEVLEQPDPRLPVTKKQDGKEVTFVRELVRVNHHRNCLLCHAPGNTDNTPDGVLKVAVPLPNEPLPKPSDGGGYQSTPPPTPDIVVRLDMTYLRQDFSLIMPVSDAHPWPEMQRFDFLVRTRTLTAAEAQAYEACCEDEEPGRLSPYHRSALYALRELTGRDTEPTPAAWRKLLKLPARNN
jgi:hypothetical protein